MIDAAFWQSETVARLTIRQRLLFVGLFSNADDQGRMKAHPLLIRSVVFPFDDIPSEQMEADIDALAELGCIILYEADGKHLLQIPNWWKYQHLRWAWPSELPAPDGWDDRLKYRQGNNVVQENWEPNESQPPATHEPAKNDVIVEPERDQNEVTVTSAPSIRDSGRDSIREEGRAQAPPSLPSGVPDPASMTVAEIKALDLDKTGWQSLANAEEAGKERAGVLAHVKRKLHAAPPAVEAYREAAGSYPLKATWSIIAETINGGDLEVWSQVVLGWIANGWNPRNVNGMLDFYRRGEIPKAGGRNTAKSTTLDNNMDIITGWEMPK